ncbi:hypothetical protein [Aureispira sp. CCB-QB1]|uniref:hypothetical protein n=1 Tax=Aureispira sp. CCB-QB1 TaxID=1313421 RepID=UPI00069635B8|nr:hypothetical protein [Aureispira sp. CCB-QB1]
MLSELFNSTHAFDKLRQGYYDEESQCGWVTECQDTKNCIARVCAPHRDAYGGTFYNSCVLACNENTGMQKLEDFVCKNPATAYKLYGITCPGYVPGGVISLFGRDIKVSQILISILLVIIIYIIIKRYQ